MTARESSVSPDPFANCDSEPVHLPGAIQPHGFLLALREPGLQVAQFSANVPALLACGPAGLPGRPLEQLLGAGPVEQLRRALAEDCPQEAQPLQFRLGERDFAGLVHRRDGMAILEIEPARAAPEVPQRFGRALRRLQSARSPAALYEVAVEEIRALTGFDRVLLYRFDADAHGEVLAEARGVALEPFLGLHFPASDIPRPVRELYRLNGLRLIPDASGEPVPLVPGLRPDTGRPLDLSLSLLRGVSPVHREYMGNMGVRASMSLPLLPRGRLWGLVSCGHGLPMQVPHEVRSACLTLGRLLSLQIAAFEDGEERRLREEKSALTARLAQAMRASEDEVLEGLARQPQDLLQLADAGGAALVVGERVLTVGACPPVERIRELVGWVGAQAGPDGVFETCALASGFPAAADDRERACGLLAFTLPKPERNAVLWFRPERVRTVNWGGNPHKSVETDAGTGRPRLRPRRSFRLWQEAVHGQARRWRPGELQAVAELRRFAIEIDLARQVLREREAVRSRDELIATAAQLTRSLEAAHTELERIAFRDPLTGLANRLVFEDRLSHACARCERYGESAAVLFIDLDGFKPINDSWGHRTGDLVLKEVAARLRRLARESDTVARLGGDEFVMLMESGGHAEAAGRLAQRVIEALVQPVAAGEREAQISCSIGIGLFPQDGPHAQLIAHADAAMYAAKRAGRGTWRFYDARMDDAGAREMAGLRGELLRGLEQDEFELLYQPKVRGDSGRVTGVEALARWNHPVRGLLEPDFFIPIIERYGLVSSFSDWVLRTAVRQLRDWGDEGLSLSLAVNLSVHQLRLEDLPERVQGLLREHGVEASRFALEITESAAMEDVEENLPIFERLAAAGITISVDDFGTGHSSLSYLRRLPVQQLKIDRSFVQDLAHSADARSIILAVVQLAHALALEVVAEGVESPQQHEILKALGCDEAQGFLFARPMRAVALAQWMRAAAPGDPSAASAGDPPDRED